MNSFCPLSQPRLICWINWLGQLEEDLEISGDKEGVEEAAFVLKEFVK